MWRIECEKGTSSKRRLPARNDTGGGDYWYYRAPVYRDFVQLLTLPLPPLSLGQKQLQQLQRRMAVTPCFGGKRVDSCTLWRSRSFSFGAVFLEKLPACTTGRTVGRDAAVPLSLLSYLVRRSCAKAACRTGDKMLCLLSPTMTLAFRRRLFAFTLLRVEEALQHTFIVPRREGEHDGSRNEMNTRVLNMADAASCRVLVDR